MPKEGEYFESDFDPTAINQSLDKLFRGAHLISQDKLRDILTERNALQAELATERARLDCVIKILNCWDMFHECHEAWHPTKRTSRLRATAAEWREFLDAAMKGTV